MTLTRGARLGRYEIDTPLGAGGMGEVYCAVDTRLNRRVAVKILPTTIAENPRRRERFEREARIISTLSHPHICALYDIGDYEGAPFLVMEYLEGETLAVRLLRGALSMQQVLGNGIAIAGALAHAHHRGIIHRDLKPENVMLTPSGVKLLDFGVAALLAPEPPQIPESAPGVHPTLTDEHVIIGTRAYMAPEQLEGRRVDARADIFAFGIVLYEMATGTRPFGGSTPASVAATIVERDALPVSAIVPSTSPLFDEIVARCLAREREERWHAAADLEQALQWIATNTASGARRPRTWAARMRSVRPVWPLGAAAVLLVIAASIGRIIQGGPDFENSESISFTIAPPDGASFNPSDAFMAISPDGRTIGFVAASSQHENTLWIRSLDSEAVRSLPGTDGAVQPFWSPDSRFLAFSSEGKLKQIELATGIVTTITAEGMTQSGSWNRDGVILVTRPANAAPVGQTEGSPLYRISTRGGAPFPATALNRALGETIHSWPAFLPDGRHFLYLARGDPRPESALLVGSLDSGITERLFASTSQAIFVPQGFLLFAQGGTLVAERFDARALKPVGTPVRLVEGVDYNLESGRAAFSASDTGVLAYRRIGTTRLTWFDRNGRAVGAVGPPGYYRNPALSPDERRVAVMRLDPVAGTQDVWTMDLDRSVVSRVTFDAHADKPLWSPDGTRLIYKTPHGFSDRAVSRAGDEHEILAVDDPFGTPLAFTPDGGTLIYETASSNGVHLWALAPGNRSGAHPLVQTDFHDIQGQVSPDGRWLAFASNESGRYEVYVQRFPSGSGRRQVSTAGGLQPQWRGDGKELFFHGADRMLNAVSVSETPTLTLSEPHALFSTRMSTFWNGAFTRNQYAVTRDGQRFLVVEPAGEPSPITVMVNWMAALGAHRATR